LIEAQSATRRGSLHRIERHRPGGVEAFASDRRQPPRTSLRELRISIPWLRFCATFSPQLAARSASPRADDTLPPGPFRSVWKKPRNGQNEKRSFRLANEKTLREACRIFLEIIIASNQGFAGLFAFKGLIPISFRRADGVVCFQ
jgi:hypothetical protein